MSKKPSRPGLVPTVIASLIIGTLAIFLVSSKLLDGFEWKLYDLMSGLGTRPPVPSDFIAVYPMEGNEKARSAEEARNVLQLLDEFGADEVAIETAVFDGGEELEALSALRSDLPALVDKENGNLERNIRSLFDAIRAGTLPPGDLTRYVDGLVAIAERGGERIKEAVGEGGNPVLGALERRKASLGIAEENFYGVEADPDGVLRRLLVVKNDEGRLIPRAELAALMARLGNPVLESAPGKVLLRGAQLPGGRGKTLVIPIDAGGKALLAWPKSGGDGYPRALSLESLLAYAAEEEDFVTMLEAMDAGGLLGGEGSALLSRYRHADLLADTAARGTKADREDWRAARADFFASSLAYFREGHEAGLVAAVEVMKNKSRWTEEELGRLDARIGEILRSYAEAKRLIEDLAEKRTALKQDLGSAFVFLSLIDQHEATSEPMVDSHGIIADPALAGAIFSSAILSQRVPSILPRLAMLALAFLLTLAVSLMNMAVKPGAHGAVAFAPIWGTELGAAILAVALSIGSLLILGKFLSPLPLLIGPLAAFLVSLAVTRQYRPGRPRGKRRPTTVAAFKATGLVLEAENLPPAETLGLLASFEARISDAVEQEEGKVVLSGPLILAVFEERRALSPGKTRALNAVQKAVVLVPDACAMRVGLDSGDCLVVERPLLPWRQRVVGLVGPAADLAQRLADLCGHFDTRILATGAVLEGAEAVVSRRSLGDLRVEATGRKAELYAIGNREGNNHEGQS